MYPLLITAVGSSVLGRRGVAEAFESRYLIQARVCKLNGLSAVADHVGLGILKGACRLGPETIVAGWYILARRSRL